VDLGSPASVVEPIVMSSMVVDALSFSRVYMKGQQDRHAQFQDRRRGQGRLDAVRSNRGVARVAM
jgi:hypothetical protein